MLQDLNGDNLWNSVLKHQTAQQRKELRELRRQEREGRGNRQVSFEGQSRSKRRGNPNGPGAMASLDRIMDLKKLLTFTSARLKFLDGPGINNPEEFMGENGMVDGMLGRGLGREVSAFEQFMDDPLL